MWWLVANLFVAHLCGDYCLQCKRSCDRKRKESYRGWGVYVHSAVICLLSWCAVWNMNGWWLALLIGGSHLAVDIAKSEVEKMMSRRNNERLFLVSFIADQMIHIGFIVMFASVWLRTNEWSEFAFVTLNVKWWVLAVCLLLASKPSNILVNHILRFCEVNIENTSTDGVEQGKFHSGALIGTMERWLTIVFVMLGQYEAIGFLLAAKSILRFSETKKGDEKSEYVLAGTFLSITIAVALGLILRVF